MGSEKSRRPRSSQDSRELDPDELAEEIELAQRARRGNAAMRVRETAVVPFAQVHEDHYPALVERTLGHVFRVLRELDEQQVDILLLRDDTRAALARLQTA